MLPANPNEARVQQCPSENQDERRRISPYKTLAVFDSEGRHFSPWRVQFGAPPSPDCPAPHRKVARTVWRPATSGLPSAAPKGGAYSLVSRHFWIAQRRTERWRVQFGAPPLLDCPAPHRKVQGNRWVVRRRTWVPPRGALRSWVCHRRWQWRSWLAVPPPRGGKGPFPDGNYGSKPKIPIMFPGCIHGKEKD